MSSHDWKEWEERLGQCHPVEPPEELGERLDRAVRQRRLRRRMERLRAGLGWAGLGIAACFLMGVGIGLWSGGLRWGNEEALVENGQEASQDGETRVRAQNELQKRVDEGLVFLDNGVAARRYRYEFIDRMVWEDPEDGTRMEVAIPREEVVLVPVHSF